MKRIWVSVLLSCLSWSLLAGSGQAMDTGSGGDPFGADFDRFIAGIGSQEGRRILLPPMRLGEMIRPAPSRAARQRLDLEQGTTGGLVPVLFRSRRPWEWLSPFAPPELGNGELFLRTDPYTGRAEGVIVFSVRLPRLEGAVSTQERTDSPGVQKPTAERDGGDDRAFDSSNVLKAAPQEMLKTR